MNYEILKYYLGTGIITIDDVVNSSQEDIMKNILDSVHKYKITKGKGKDTRFITYIPDPTKLRGTRQVRTETLSEMYEFLCDFYHVSYEKPIAFSGLWTERIEYKRKFIGKKIKGISQSTIRRYERDYTNYISSSSLSEKNIRSLSPITLEKILIEIVEENKMSLSCAKNVLGYIRMCFDFAYRSDYISSNIYDKVDRNLILSCCTVEETKPDSDRILTESELFKLSESVNYHLQRHPLYMPDYAIKLAILTGMRVGEIAALHWTDLDDLHIHIDFSEHRLDYSDRSCELVIGEPKNRKHRTIPLTKDLKDLFSSIKSLNLPGDFIFCRENGERYTAHDISCAVDRRAKEGGIKKTSIHGIRRTVSSMLNEKLPQKAVASILGHLETTNERFYNYDVHEDKEKIIALQDMASSVIICHHFSSVGRGQKETRNAV